MAGKPATIFGTIAAEKSNTAFGAHSVTHWEVLGAKRLAAIAEIRDRLPGHYRSAALIKSDIKRLGGTKTAQALELKLPTRPNARSGDLGEMLAVEFIEETTSFSVPLRKLRYRDDRNLALRGDDVLAFRTRKGSFEVLKTEAKSAKILGAFTVKAATLGLGSDGGRPKYHAAFFVADRLRESGNAAQIVLGETIHDHLVGRKIPLSRTYRLLFVVRGGGGDAALNTAVSSLSSMPPHRAVCALTVSDHKDFVAKVFTGPFKLA